MTQAVILRNYRPKDEHTKAILPHVSVGSPVTFGFGSTQRARVRGKSRALGQRGSSARLATERRTWAASCEGRKCTSLSVGFNTSHTLRRPLIWSLRHSQTLMQSTLPQDPLNQCSKKFCASPPGKFHCICRKFDLQRTEKSKISSDNVDNGRNQEGSTYVIFSSS